MAHRTSTKWTLGVAVVTVGVVAAAPVLAQETVGGEVSTDDLASAPRGDRPGPLVLGAKVGAIFPQPFSKLGSHVAFGVEGGYRLPFLDERIEAMGAAGFSPPGTSFTDTHTDGAYQGELDQQELTFSLGGRGRFLPIDSQWNVTGGLGGRLFLLRTTSNGSKDGQSFMQYTEQSTKVGFFLAVGGEYRLGPGAISLDLDLGWSPLNHRITGSTSTGNLTATVGYRLFLL
jgi:hypothetical protein